MTPLVVMMALLANAEHAGTLELPHGAPVLERFNNGNQWLEARRLGTSASGRVRVMLLRDGLERGEAEVGLHALVLLRDGLDELAERAGVTDVRRLWPTQPLFRVRSVNAAEDGLALAARLSTDAHVAWATPDLFLEHQFADFKVPPNDPRYTGQWYLTRLDVEPAWRITAGAASVTVAVVDNGCDTTHPDLLGNLRQGRDVVDSDDDPSPGASTRDANHGTACAGLIAATGNNAMGISGVCPQCTLRCIRMLAERGQMVPVSVDVEAFRSALTLDVAVVSNSWGFVNAIPVPAALALAIREVATRGRGGRGSMVVFAAGNDNRELLADELYSLPEVITIGAINTFDELASFSNRGAALDAVAPTGTFTTDLSGAAGADPGDYTSLFGGTSAACPVAAGVAGLLVSLKPEASRVQLEQWLIGTTRRAPFAVPDARGHDPLYGFGIVSASAALRRAAGLEVVDAGVKVVDAGVNEVTVDGAPEALGGPARGCGCEGGLGAPLVFLALALFRHGRVARTQPTSRLPSGAKGGPARG